jgi:hypothetical protein
MIRRRERRALLALALVIALLSLSGLGVATRAWQPVEIFSPASGHAQVIAQGVATLPGEVAWRAIFYAIDPGASGERPAVNPGFVLVDTGGLLVEDGANSTLLAPSEALFQADRAARLVPVGDRPVGLFAIDLVPPDTADDAGAGIPVYASAPFAAPSGPRDIDLVRDLLEPEESTTVIGNETPVLVLVTLGAVRVEATDGSAASLRVGEAATFSGDIVLTAEGQAPSTFVAAVIGRQAPVAGAEATPGASPVPDITGSVQTAVYACPPVVTPADASPGNCLRDAEAVALTLAAVADSALQDVGPSSERDGLPTWTGLPAGDYVLQASGFKPGFGRFVARGLAGTDDRGADGYGVEEADGFLVPIGVDTADFALEVYVFGPSGDGTPSAAPAETAVAQPAETPSGDVEFLTPIPDRTPTPTPRPEPIVTATPRATEEPRLVTSTAVARPSNGTVDVRIFGCLDSIETFDPANCAQAVDGFDIQLISEDGEIIPLSEAAIGPDGSVTWEDLPLGTYLFQQPLMLPGAATYFIPNLPLADDGSGYVVTIGPEEPVATLDVFSLPPPPVPTAAPIDPATLDSDADGILDGDETAVFGTDPLNADSDFDGVLDGAEVAAGTNPLVADAAPTAAPAVEPAADSDGDRLLDGDEVAFGTDPNVADTDGDGYFDGDEINLGTDPLNASSFPTG